MTLYQLIPRLASQAGAVLNTPVKLIRHEGWTEVRIYTELKGFPIPYARTEEKIAANAAKRMKRYRLRKKRK